MAFTLVSPLRAMGARASRPSKGGVDAAPQLSGVPSSAVCLWLVRHGERVDETCEAQAFFRECDEEGGCWRDDAPLTERGRGQAEACGLRFRDAVAGQDAAPPPFLLFTSPLQRAVATAEEMAFVLGVQSVEVLPGLSECAAAVRQEGLRESYPKMQFARGAYKPARPVLFRIDPDRGDGEMLGDRFKDALARAARVTADAELRHAVVVCHREGLYDTIEAISPRRGGALGRMPYCAVSAVWLSALNVELIDPDGSPRTPPARRAYVPGWSGALALLPTDKDIAIDTILDAAPPSP